MDDEFPSEYRAMAIDYNIPVVSTVWVVQSLIIGQVCDPSQHELLTQLYDDENLWWYYDASEYSLIFYLWFVFFSFSILYEIFGLFCKHIKQQHVDDNFRTKK